MRSFCLLAVAICFPFAAGSAAAQLRIVTYNPTGSPPSGVDIILRVIGEEARNGMAKPIDVLLLQEQNNPSAGVNRPSSDTQAFVTLLNSMYAGQGITYAMGVNTGFGDTTQTLVYRTQTVQLLGEAAVGTTSGTGQPRQAMRYKLAPVGYDGATSFFYAYNSHYKASAASDDSAAPGRRNVEAMAIRANSNALGEGTHAIYAGDHNFYDYTAAVEPAFQTLIAAGAGQANDPINRVGTWHNNPSYADVHTQSPCASGCGGVSGGMDDRFDFQLVTGEFLDGEGMSIIGGSYHVLGNNGSTYNGNINSSANTYVFTGVTSYTKAQVLNALWSATDHLPVVADYQIPARMGVQVASIPTFVELGSSVSFNVTVTNTAPTLFAAGADELDYALSVTGSLVGGATGMDAATGGGNVHQVALDTSTLGARNGVLTVSSASQQAAGVLFSLPLSFQVIAAFLAADFNRDGAVNAADLSALTANFGLQSALKAQGDANLDGSIDGRDFLVWQQQLGQLPAGAALLASVPEPGAVVLLTAAGVAICAARRRR